MKRIITIIICVLLISGCSNKLKQTTKTIEYGKEYDISEIFEIKEGVKANIDGKTTLKISKLGNQDVMVNIDNDGKTSTSTYTFKVVDTTPPSITLENSELLLGNEFKAENFVKLEDNVDSSSDIILKVESGNINKDIVGDYDIVLSATDKSNNTTSSQITISVVEPKTSVNIGEKYTATGDSGKIEFTINSISWQQTVESYSTNMFRSYYSDISGETYFVVKMTIKNIGSSSTGYSIFDMYGATNDPQVIFDNYYNYFLFQMDTTSSVLSPYWSLEPLKTMDVFMLATIPDELVGKEYEVNFATSDTKFVCYGE